MSTKKIAIIGGSGLDDPQILKDIEKISIDTPYGKTSSSLLSGKINGTSVVVLARHGSKHTITPTHVPFRANIWALKEIGCTHIVATTACGSLKEGIRPGDLIFLDQFIDFTKHRNLTFFDDEVIHTPMADPFCNNLRNLIIDTASELNLPHHKTGTILTIEGPRFSTRAESKYFAQIGADVINMSTVPEVILARELGICYASVAMSTDYDSWKKNEEAVTWEKILQVMQKNATNVKKLLIEAVPKIDSNQCAQCKKN